MNVTCFFADGTGPAWASGLATALPEASVTVWQKGDPPADYAVVWKPSQRFIDAQTALKAIFNAGQCLWNRTNPGLIGRCGSPRLEIINSIPGS